MAYRATGSRMDDTFYKHQLRIARDTLRMSDVGANIMGGMTKDEARQFLKSEAGWSATRLASFEEA